MFSDYYSSNSRKITFVVIHQTLCSIEIHGLAKSNKANSKQEKEMNFCISNSAELFKLSKYLDSFVLRFYKKKKWTFVFQILQNC